MTLVMFDSITVATIPPGPHAVAGYVGGKWPTYNELVKTFPNARHLSIAVNASEDAECLDIENGDATPVQAPAWVKRQQARGVLRPVLYASISSMAAVHASLSADKIVRANVRLWTAHYTQVPHVCAPTCGFQFQTTADATQWTDRALGRNLDESLCVDTFFPAPAPPPPPPDPYHYSRFATQPTPSPWGPLSEHDLVLAYDAARRAPLRNRGKLGTLREQLHFLAFRVLLHGEHDGDFATSERSWRYEQLRARELGGKLA